jgi:hypothetical protein
MDGIREGGWPKQLTAGLVAGAGGPGRGAHADGLQVPWPGGNGS